jgi:STE24 endopeptidase
VYTPRRPAAQGKAMATELTHDPPELESASPEIKRYQRQKLQVSIANTLVSFFWLALLGFGLGPHLGAKYTEWFGDNQALRLLASAFVLGVSLELLTLPLDFWSGFVLEHRYHLSNQTFAGWVWKRVKSYLVGGVLGFLLLFGLYGILWATGDWWWLWATAGWLLMTLVLGRLLPVVILPLFYKVTRLEDALLLDRLRRLTAGTDLTVEGIYQLHLSEETKKANAALAGLGKSRRVLLGDTLLTQFTPEEIEVVFAHEVGHHVHKHLPKMIVVGTVLALTGFFLVDVVLGRSAGLFGYLGLAESLGYQGLADSAALPLLVLVLGAFGLVLSPAQNALSRFFERQCDRYALQKTGNAEAYRSAFTKLARLNKADPDPHPLVAWLFYDHPPIRERLALAEQ